MFGLLIVLVVAGTSIWVVVDASHLGVRRGSLGPRSMGPTGWFVCCLLLWIIAFPYYLYARPRYVAYSRLPEVGGAGRPDWYRQPTGGLRWWDGKAWGPLVPPK